MEVTLRTRNVDMLSKLGHGLKRQFELQKLCDVTLTTNQRTPRLTVTQSIECHKVVLSSSSKYFEQYMIDNGDEVNIIDVSSVNIDVMKEVLGFLYNGECLICESNVFELLDTAKMWVVPDLAAECCRYLINTKTLENVCHFYEALSKFDHEETSAKLCYFIREHFKELHENKQISCLSVRSFNKVIAFDDIHVDSEDLIFQSAEMIVEKSADAVDQEDLAKCWKLIRFEFMSLAYLVDTVILHDLLRDAPQNNYVKHAIAYNHKDSLVNNNRSPRTWTDSQSTNDSLSASSITRVDNRELVYINAQKMVCRFNKIENSWEEIMQAPDWIDDTTVVASCPAGLIVAGKYCSTNGNRVSLLDLHNRCEIIYPNLTYAMYGCVIHCSNDMVYLIGGMYYGVQRNWVESRSVFKIRETDSSWTACAHFDTGSIITLASAPINSESCYLVGSRSAYMFCSTTAQCTALPEHPQDYDHSSAGVVVYKNQLTVVQHDQVMIYERPRWIIKRYKALAGLKQVMVYNGEIHACVDDGNMCKIMKYDAENILWEDAKIPTVPKSYYSHQMTIA